MHLFLLTLKILAEIIALFSNLNLKTFLWHPQHSSALSPFLALPFLVFSSPPDQLQQFQRSPAPTLPSALENWVLLCVHSLASNSWVLGYADGWTDFGAVGGRPYGCGGQVMLGDTNLRKGESKARAGVGGEPSHCMALLPA